jgi:hypothetical protein
MRIQIETLTSEKVLSGALPGRQALASILANIPSFSEPERIYLDFQGIETATASYLRESIVGFRNYALSSLNNVYPVIANAAPSVLEEIDFLVKHLGDTFWCCNLDLNGTVSDAKLLGTLDPAQYITFQLLIQLGSASARDLAKHEPEIGITAWNNRLASLAAKGLLIESRHGKTKIFAPVLEVS